MKEIAADLRRWRGRGDKQVALATVVATRGSAPRPIGSKLAISEQGELAGSVSGGCVENEVYEESQAVLAGAEPCVATTVASATCLSPRPRQRLRSAAISFICSRDYRYEGAGSVSACISTGRSTRISRPPTRAPANANAPPARNAA